ncbi:MAG TPA: hypothetical protein VGL13_18460, partial [Polyangiaceae bacterium]
MTASSLAFPAADENIDAPPSGGSTAELSHEAPPGVQALSPEALARAQALSLQALAGAQSTERVSVAATRASRFVEFMAVGGATLFLFPIAWAARAVVGLDHADYAFGFLTFYGAYLINDPHFSVTYLLFYRDARRRALRSQYDWGYRVRYIVAGLVVPAALLLWAIASLRSHSAQSLGWMVQLMYLLVGWHYVKQGFGALMVLSARRGTRFNSMERIVVLTHCFAGWSYAWALRAAAGGEFEEKGVVYTALVHPHWLALAAGIVLGTSSIALVVVLAMKWRR